MVYERKGVRFTVADDFSTVEVGVGGSSVTVEVAALADLLVVLEAAVKRGDPDRAGLRLWNIVPTTLSAGPEGVWR